MLDIKDLATHYIPQNIKRLEEYSNDQNDLQASNTLRSLDKPRLERAKQLLNWLHSYHVLQSFTSEIERQIADQVIEFADTTEQTNLEQNKDLILKEFKRLESMVQQVVPANKNGKPRNVTSLVSKALWCCYPNDVPIYDNYAEHALQVICRICNIQVTGMANGSNTKYGCFLEAWFRIYKEIKPIIDDIAIGDYPYRIRVLDWLLWYIGKPKFDVAQKVQAGGQPSIG